MPAGYLPAYLRRYPFVLIEQPGGKGSVLGIDASCDGLVEHGEDTADTQPLFRDGQPTETTREALRFCGAFQADYGLTIQFCNALAENGLLVENQAQALLPGGRRFSVQGFRVVDKERFAGLAETIVVEWHRKGWLALVTLHLTSLERWNDLLELQAARQQHRSERI
jgi:SapC